MWKPLITCVVAALAFTGCASGATEEPAPKPTAEETEAAPLVDEETGRELTAVEKEFLASVSAADLGIDSEEGLLEAGRLACEQQKEWASAANPREHDFDFRVIDGEEPDAQGRHVGSAFIGLAAGETLCPTGQ